MPRTVDIQLTDEDLIAMGYPLVSIGYLSTWALDAYDTVTIFRDGRSLDMVAHFRSTATGRTYTIGAVRNADGSYGYHS
jgi:hypothetical protein